MESLRERKKARTRAAIAAAALRLFAERGFHAVTVADVAVAAEVGERTLFRYFADKEELLFGEDEAFRAALTDALAAQPAEDAPAAALAAATGVLTAALAGRRDELAARRGVIRSTPALIARERAKHAAFETAIAEGLQVRGTDAAAARLVARIGVVCFDEATEDWLADADAEAPGLAARVAAKLDEAGALLSHR